MRSYSPPWMVLSGLLALVSAGILGCTREAPRLTVHAAASLTDVLPRVAEQWQQAGGQAVTFAFGPSSRLAKQLEAGAPGDLYLSADSAWMDYAEDRNLLASGSRTDLLANELVLVVPRDSSLVPASPTELRAAGRRLTRLALAGEGVPAGRYARAALEQTAAMTALLPAITSADDVRMALAWVARGEAEAGVVYATDAAADPRVKVAFAFAPSTHPPIIYPAAVLRGSSRAKDAEAFLEHCRTAEARALFQAAGFVEVTAP